MKLIEGYDDAFLGTALIWSRSGTRETVAVYSGNVMVEQMMQDDPEADFDDALEYATLVHKLGVELTAKFRERGLKG